MGAFKQGMKAGFKSNIKAKTVSQDQLIQSKNVKIVQKQSRFFKNRINFKGSMDATISTTKEPVKVTFEGVSVKTKTGTISRGSMIVRQNIKQGTTILSKSTPYNFLSEGEILRTLRSPKGVKIVDVKSLSLTATRDYKNMTLSKSKSLVLSKGDKVKVKGFLDWGRYETGMVDYNTKIISIQPAEKSSFVTAGKFVTKQGGKGNIAFTGNIYTIESGKNIKQVVTIGKRSFLKSTSATGSMIRQPNVKNVFSVDFLQDVGANISDFNASLPAMNVKTFNVSSKTATIPLLKSNISSNIVNQKKYNITSTKQNIKTTNKTIQITPLKYNVANEIKQDRLLSNLQTNSFITETKSKKTPKLAKSFINTQIQQTQQAQALKQDNRFKFDTKQSQAYIQRYDLSLINTGVGGFGFGFSIPEPIPVVPTPFVRMGGTYTAILNRPKQQRINLIGKKQKIQKLEKGLLPDPLSVLRSQIRYGSASQPKLTSKLWKIGEKTRFMHVPTKEMLKDKKKKKRRKKYEFI